MPIAKIEPTGCGGFHGNVKVRLAFYLEPDDARYDKRHYLAPIIPPKGYLGKVDELGGPLDQADYNAWIEGLPKKWVLAPFHNHFLYLPPDVTEDVIIAKANFHLPNFYAAWLQELDKIPGGMRKGWDIETRKRPRRYDREMTLTEYQTRKLACLNKVDLIIASNLSSRSKDTGEIFPATEIDIGPPAIDSADNVPNMTVVNKDNPANDTGAIDEVEIWAHDNLTDLDVATFFVVSGDNLSTRDTEAIGAVTGGSKQTFSSLDMDVTAGDYIGWFASDDVHQTLAGYAGFWYVAGVDHIPCTNQAFTFLANRATSLYGTGETITATPQAVGGATMSIAGSLLKETDKFAGGASMTIAGALTAYRIFVRAVGGASMAITGALAKIQIYARAVGSGAIAIAGSVLKKTSKNIGGDMTIAGSLLKKTLKLAGSGTMAIAGSVVKSTSKLAGAGSIASAGTLTAYKIFVKAVGAGTVAIAGTLTYVWRWLEVTVKFYSRAKTMFMYTWRKWLDV